MKKLKQITSILKSINAHPLAGRHRLKAYLRFIRWQIAGFINSGEKQIVFTDRTYLLAKRGMEGATGNIYMGLHEFPDMGFLLHFLRSGDLFFDIGANVGSYTVLASGHIGAHTISFEPVPSTFRSLEKNIKVNNIGLLVKAYNVGVSSKRGKLIFTTFHDSINHVLKDYEGNSPDVAEVEVVTVDEIVAGNRTPVLIKIDVEGYETEVLNGMNSALSDNALKGIIIELNGSGERYGYDENKIHSHLANLGFKSYQYDPFKRQLEELNTHGHFNTLYLRNMSFIKDRLKKAESISLFSETF